jgi:hypothetical protein
MKPMLDDLELLQVQEISTYDRRALVEYKPPGMAGSILQNLGRRPARMTLWGVATGPDALAFAQKLDGKFRAGKPAPFTSDIVKDSNIDQVLIEGVQFEELAGRPQRFAYVLKLLEYIKPAEPADASSLDTSILDDAKNLMDGIVDGLGIGLNFATGLERFVPTMSDLLTRLTKFGDTINNPKP